MVPRKPEKRTPRDPVEGSEASGQGTADGNMNRTPSLISELVIIPILRMV
jgi:hypothetical protein